MEDSRAREESAALGAAIGGAELRDRISTALAIDEVKDGGASSTSNCGESSLLVKMGKEEKVIRWDRILPRKFLRVLLVENDDSTRQIVATLLRKCSYQVAAVADGLKAWEVLNEKHYNFDIVLTEVVMPSLSGIGLLSKIMGNEICKNIPVIMMSSHDSIGIVFKCMLKGAADFLVKPVRKNELRNLWQHVWRKYCSSGYGMGSENRSLDKARLETVSDNVAAINHGNSNADHGGMGSENRSLDKARLETVSDNVAAINHGNSNADHGSKTADSVDKESDTESSCIKTEANNGSLLKLREAPECEYRNFILEIDAKSKKLEYDMSHEKGKVKGIEIKMSLSIQAAASTKNILEDNSFYDGSPYRDDDQVSARSKEGATRDSEHLNQLKGTNELSKEIIDFIGATSTEQSKFPILKGKDHAEDISCKNEETPDVRRNTFNSGSSQLWELSLRGPQFKFNGDEVSQEKHVLNQSHASAFSRYGGGRLHVSCPGSSSASLCIRTSGFNGSNCHINPGIDKGKSTPFPLIGKLTSPHRNGGEALSYYQLSSGSSKEDAGPSASVSVRKNACVCHSPTERSVLPHPQLEAIPLSVPVGALPFQNFCAGYGAILQPIFCPKPSRPLCGSSEIEKAIDFNPSAQDCNLVNKHHVKSSDCFEDCQPHLLKKVMEDEISNIKTSYPSVMLRSSYETVDQIGNCSRGITDASGCNGSNDDTSAAFNMGTILESANEDGFQNCNGKLFDRSCSQREAALTRFRLKRKDRCFEKKVRYHSRKKLAEQRPRLKGQFVRQAGAESARIISESDD
ncbi:two-component response regulator-like APRR3 isoform X2 [Macadamia integrifolia]|uniref:two-component response regulator-like APRR3 isoform X2 n=1 Tax=Macadamia integrifolia TaxID=60698 RepID=UPI001C4E619F|nr:two-component response regulator-like APRR3 isoform X2 [Macadamia integrifolia]